MFVYIYVYIYIYVFLFIKRIATYSLSFPNIYLFPPLPSDKEKYNKKMLTLHQRGDCVL